ncbi:MAG: alpha/beta hydrolase [Pseudomonadota bacterium]
MSDETNDVMTPFSWEPGTPHSVKVAGAALEVEVHGPAPGASPTIILLHEGLGCVALWRDFPVNVANATGCGVLAYSRAGYGRSGKAVLPRPTDYMSIEATEVLPEVIAQCRIGSYILLGHSDGATIAAIHAGDPAAARCAGLILMAPHFFTEPMGLAAIRQAGRAFETTDLGERLSKYHMDAEHSFRGWNDVWLSKDFEAWNVADVIDRWQAPALAIQGDDDEYGTLAQIREIERRAKVPLDVLIAKNCGHSPQFGAPDETLAAVVSFVRSISAGNP